MTLTNDKPQAVPILEEPSDLSGVALNKVFEGDPAAGKKALAALISKDAAGNLQYPVVNQNNELVVSTESGDIACLSDSGNVTGSNSTEQTVVSITLQNDYTYRKLGWSVSNFRQTEYRIVWVDDVGGGGETETELNTILVGPSDYNDSADIDCLSFTAGATGVQELRLYGLNKDAASQLRGMISVEEVQPQA